LPDRRAVIGRRALLRVSAVLAGGLLLPAAGRILAAQAGRIDGRLAELGVTLPQPPAPLANYVAWQVQNGFAYIAGQIPMRDGQLLHPGSVPNEVSIEQGREAARQCAINILAALKGACDGNLDRVRQCMRLEGFVASAAGFNEQPAVVNGASDFMVEVFGDAGRHTRVAVGVNELPLNACVEVSAIFAID
jgi:enamine deaminase RidA (YjgF/YER057c/UK114 family)